MNLLAGSTGFLGNNILKELGFNKSPTLALGRRAIPNLPDNSQELLIDFENLDQLSFSEIDHVYLSLGYPLIYHNVMGLMSTSLKKDFFLVDFTYQLEIAKKAKEAGAKNISLISAVAADSNSWNYYLKTKGVLEEEYDICLLKQVEVCIPQLKDRGQFQFVPTRNANVFLKKEWAF